VCASSAAGTTRSTNPTRYASSASKRRDDHNRSSARLVPTRRGRSQLVPCSAIRPRRENEVVNDAVSAAKRRSHIIASTKPPPAATPLTAAMTGFGTRSKKLNSAGSSATSARALPWPEAVSVCGGALVSVFVLLRELPTPDAAVASSVTRSSPAQNPRPLPVMTMPITTGSAAARSTQLRIAAIIGCVIALSLSGRRSVTVATGPST
jgi:hypothetical protein